METNRLILRERTPELLTTIFTKSVEEQLVFFGYSNQEELVARVYKLKKGLVNWKQDYKMWDLIEKESLLVAGSIGYHSWYTEHQRAEIGYSLHESFHGLGFAKEALKKVIDFGFYDMDLLRIEAFVEPTNVASLKIMEHFGFTYEGLFRKHYRNGDSLDDSMCFGLLKEEYEEKILFVNKT